MVLAEYWESWTDSTFTSPRVRNRIAELDLDPNTGNGRSFWITIPELYTDSAIEPANLLLARAVASCGAAAACGKVAKARKYMEYLLLLRAAINSTNTARQQSKEDVNAGFWTQTVDAAEMVSDATALTQVCNRPPQREASRPCCTAVQSSRIAPWCQKEPGGGRDS